MLTVNPGARRRRAVVTLARRTRHPLTVPLLMAVLVLAVGAQVACVFKFPSWGNDEPAHLGYVAALARGDLPTIESDTVPDPAAFGDLAPALEGWDEEHGDIWTANHPPLFHLALLPLWWAGDGEPQQVFIALRLVNTLGFAAWVFLVGLIARELVPRRPAVPALAAVVAAAPTLALRGGFLMNDGVGSAAALLLLWTTVRMLRDRTAGTWLAVGSAAGVVAAGTRASGVLMVAACCVALLVAVRRREGARRALLAAGVVGGVPALATGWFYLRNLRLYGDVTGQAALLDKFDRSPVTAIGQVWSIPSVDEAVFSMPITLLVLVGLVPVLVAGRLRRAGLRADAAWLLLIAHGLVTATQIVAFLRAGGGYHDRYLMTTMPLLATAAALAMLEVGRRSGDAVPPTTSDRREWLVATRWATVLLVWLGAALVVLERVQIFGRQDHHPVEGPLPEALVAVAALAGALVWATFAVRARGDQVRAEPAR